MLIRWTTLLLLVPSLLAQVEHVVIVGVDGLSPKGLRAAAVPAIDALRAKGIWTYHARGVFPTVSSPNWASMIMGAGPEQHGITSNDWKPGQGPVPPVCTNAPGRFPTLFGQLRAQRPSAVIGIFHHWDGFGRLVEPNVADRLEAGKTAPATMAAALTFLRQRRPHLLFIHLDSVDHAGHEHGHGSPEYRSAVSEADKLIGQLVDTVHQTNLASSTAILITADHGGIGKKHGGMSLDELEIPWILHGPGIPAGGEMPGPVNTIDTAATAAHLLGIAPSPCWTGRSRLP
jgi:predicted AlkP superfamily pyrophosphatase or phosphodiesterase